jgi:UDPglucose 6-dehydrogenase
MPPIGSDPRIDPYFLQAGLGYVGLCFPKDVKSLIKVLSNYGLKVRMAENEVSLKRTINSKQQKVQGVCQKMKYLVTGATGFVGAN